MKFQVKDHKGFENVRVSYVFSESNLHIFIHYDIDTNWAITAVTCTGKDHFSVFIMEDKKRKPRSMAIKLIPENPKEKSLIGKSLAYFRSCDSINTVLILMPTLTRKRWDKRKHAKRVA
jgi:hypothetical protein